MTRPARRSLVLACLVVVALTATAANAQHQSAQWIGPGLLWSEPQQWNIGVTPCNAGALTFDARIPPGFGVVQDSPTCAVDHFELDAGSSLIVPAGSGQTAATCDLGGHVSSVQSTFTCAACTLGGTFESIGGSIACPSAAAVIPWQVGLAASAGGAIQLGVTSIPASFDDGNPGLVTTASVVASSQGVIDLPNLGAVTAPVRREDSLALEANDGGELHVGSLSTIGTAGGWSSVRATGGSVLALPGLTGAANAAFSVASGGIVSTAGSPPWSLDWSGAGASVEDILLASDPGAQLQLPTLQSLNDAYDDGDPTLLSSQSVSASLGAVVDLSGLQTVTGPVRPEDSLAFDATGGGTIDLAGLQTTSTPGGVIRLFADGVTSAITLPAASSLANTRVLVQNGASVSSTGGPPLVFSWASYGRGAQLISATQSGSTVLLPNARRIDSSFDDGDPATISGHTIVALFGGHINLSGVTEVVAPQRAEDELDLMAFSGGVLDLSSLVTIRATATGAGSVLFGSNASTITLGAFSPFTPAFLGMSNGRGPGHVTVLRDVRPAAATSLSFSGGTTRFDVGGDLGVDPPSVLVVNQAQVTVAGSLEHVQTSESLHSLGNSQLAMVGTGVRQLEVGGANVGIPAGPLANDNFGFGQLVVGNGTDPVTVELRDRCDNGNHSGSAPEALYLFGLDPAGGLGGNPLGTDGLRIRSGSTLNLGGLPTYSFQAGSWVNVSSLVPVPGACISFDGGTLCSDDTDHDGVMDAADNCPSISNPTQSDQDSDGVGDACDSCTTVANPRAACGYLSANPWATLTGGQRDDDHDGFGNACDADFPGTVQGGNVNAADLAQFRASNGSDRTLDTCGTTHSKPCAIFDLNEAGGNVNAADLARFRSLNGAPAGPKCSTCPLRCEAGGAGSCTQ